MRMRSWTGKNCVAEDPNNAFGCYWRYDAQAFEGCGCVVAAAATCLCDRVADVTVSEYKIDTVSLDELTSLSTGDVLNTWRVLAVVGGMFFGSLLLASALHLRATLGKRRLLRCVLLYKNILFTHRSVSTFDRVGPFQLTDELFWNGPHQTSRRPREKSRLGFRRRPTRLDVAHRRPRDAVHVQRHAPRERRRRRRRRASRFSRRQRRLRRGGGVKVGDAEADARTRTRGRRRRRRGGGRRARGRTPRGGV